MKIIKKSLNILCFGIACMFYVSFSCYTTYVAFNKVLEGLYLEALIVSVIPIFVGFLHHVINLPPASYYQGLKDGKN